MVRKIFTPHGDDAHHYIHRLSSVFVLDNHAISARILHGNTFDCQTGKPPLVERDHILEK